MLSQVAEFASILWLRAFRHLCVCACVYPVFSLSFHFFDGYLGCFHVLAMANSAAVNTGMHVSFQISVFVFFG